MRLAWYIAASACLSRSAASRRVGGEQADADARAELELGAADAERGPELVEQLVGDRLRQRAAVAGRAVEHEHELVAAVAGERVGAVDARPQALRQRADQLVAGLVAERVVDRLEVVHVEVEQRDRRGPRAARASTAACSRSASPSRLSSPVRLSWDAAWASSRSLWWRAVTLVARPVTACLPSPGDEHDLEDERRSISTTWVTVSPASARRWPSSTAGSSP